MGERQSPRNVRAMENIVATVIGKQLATNWDLGNPCPFPIYTVLAIIGFALWASWIGSHIWASLNSHFLPFHTVHGVL